MMRHEHKQKLCQPVLSCKERLGKRHARTTIEKLRYKQKMKGQFDCAFVFEELSYKPHFYFSLILKHIVSKYWSMFLFNFFYSKLDVWPLPRNHILSLLFAAFGGHTEVIFNWIDFLKYKCEDSCLSCFPGHGE